MSDLVLCVPNFSEGRRSDVIEEIVGAIHAAPRAQVLDVHSDFDHNRTVVSFVGPLEAVEEAAFQAVTQAAQRIDMDRHQGEHPRMGATDVVPFVPVSGVTMEDCVALAQRVGKRVGEELKIPVYLYEAAATRPDRINLADVRRGEYEALKAEIGTNSARTPDFGPSEIGPAGATAIGARPFLVAFNVYLNTDDVNTAKAIARAARHSSGGLRYVKALGLLVEGQAQVSMNLTNLAKTPPERVTELIRREAARYGLSITHTEIVGLVPQSALVNAAQWYLQLDGFEPEQVLENRISALPSELTPTEFLDAVAASTATPGGGSVAALAGALAAALAVMVGRLTTGRKRYAEVETEMQKLVEEGEELRARLTTAITRDSQAFEKVMEALRLPRETDEERALRTEAIESATRQAAVVPLEVARDALATMRLAVQAAAQGNRNAISDAAAAALMARAAIGAAALNVKINAQSLNDKSLAGRWSDELSTIQSQAKDHFRTLDRALSERASLRLTDSD